MEVINEKNFENEVLKSEQPVLVEFFTTWSGPSHVMIPVMNEIEREMANKVKFVKIDTDAASKIVKRHNIRFIPTFVLFKGGKVLNKHVGAVSKEDLTDWIESRLSSQSKKSPQKVGFWQGMRTKFGRKDEPKTL